MKKVKGIIVVFCSVLVFFASSLAIALQVDYTPSGSPLSPSPWVNPGGIDPSGHSMDSFRVDGNGTYAAPGGTPTGLAYTLTSVAVPNTYDWGSASTLGTDGFFENGSHYLTISNAPAGTWEMTTYHGQDWGASTYDILVDSVLTVDEHVVGTAAAPSAAIFNVVSNGVDDIIIEIASSTGNGYTFINGFETSIPLPESSSDCPGFLAGFQVGTVASGLIDEVSGIVASRKNDDVLWVHNDSGDSARIYALTISGQYLGLYNLSGASAVDYEDIAIGPGPVEGVDYIYVGDIGDNVFARSTIVVYRVPEPVVDSRQSPVAETLTGVESITLQYPDGAHNSETLMLDPLTKDIYVVTKDISDFRVYLAPYPQSTTSTTTMEYKRQLSWGYSTGGDISPDGSMVLIRGYYQNASIWHRPENGVLWEAFDGDQCNLAIRDEPQGEAICFDPNGCGLYTLSERSAQPIYYYPRNAICPLDVLLGDIEGDRHVDWFDFSVLAQQWLSLPGVPSADISPQEGDGIVDLNDVSVLAADWLDCGVMAAQNPQPPDGAQGVSIGLNLSWIPMPGVIWHDVYIGTDSTAVSQANKTSLEFQATVSDSNYAPAGLSFDTDYYWRADEVGNRCVTKGNIWHFKTAP